MTRIVKTLLLVLGFLTVMVAPGWSVEVGEPMPDFALQTFDGSKLSRATLEGKPLLLVFWNTWCPNCMREFPGINRLAEEFGPRGLKVLAINTGINDAEGKARAFWKKHGYGFPTGYDHVFEIGQAFGVRGVPTIFLVDSKGVVRYKHVQLPENMEEHFKQLIRN
ncbi:MAG TPA: TlpA disulfide reductase family protein [Desulfuromonadales bacterium]|nr:TlpA disulfide reductase family protein [Desulfuromonadales bacterium]